MSDKIKFFALGGLDESGKNMYIVEVNDKIFILDCGLKYPSKNITGVDAICSDMNYIIQNKARVKAIIVSHSHFEECGAIPVLCKFINVPVYCTEFTRIIIEHFNSDFEINTKINYHIISPTYKEVIDGVQFSFTPLTHSVPGSVSVKIHTSQGIIAYIPGLIFDPTAERPFHTGLKELQFGDKDSYLALLCSSSGSTKQGYTVPKHKIKKLIQSQFDTCEGKLMIANYSSNLFNLKEIFDLCEKYNKTVFLYSRSMDDKRLLQIKNYFISQNICSPNIKIGKLANINRVKDSDIALLFLGSVIDVFDKVSNFLATDGKELHFELTSKDVFINNCIPIASKEVEAVQMLDNLYRTDMKIQNITSKDRTVIALSEEDIKQYLVFLNPKYVIPVDGYFFELMNTAKIVLSSNKKYNYSNILVLENGVPVTFENSVAKADYVNKIETADMFIDGIDIGNVGNNVVEERNEMSSDGIVIMGIVVSKSKKAIVGGPDVQMRGFVFLKDSENILREITNIFVENIRIYLTGYYNKKQDILDKIIEQCNRYIRKETGKKPVIIPEIIEIN